MKTTLITLSALLLIGCGFKEEQSETLRLGIDNGMLQYQICLNNVILKNDTISLNEAYKIADSLYLIEREKTIKRVVYGKN
jgi:hypothetical protein